MKVFAWEGAVVYVENCLPGILWDTHGRPQGVPGLLLSQLLIFFSSSPVQAVVRCTGLVFMRMCGLFIFPVFDHEWRTRRPQTHFYDFR